MKPLHIVQAAAFPFPSPQGSQVYVAGMCKALLDRGHRVTLACYGHGVGEVDPRLELLRAPRLPGYDNMRAGPDLAKPLLDAFMAAQLARIAPDVDIIHAHNYEAPIAAYLARLRRRVPVVYNNHNTMGEELPSYFQGRVARGLARRFGALLDRQVPRRADACLAISEQVLPQLQAWGCPQVVHVPPGVDLGDLEGADGARARERYQLAGRPWVIYAGNPDRYQDLDILVDAVLQLPELGLILVSAADMDELAARAAPLGAQRLRVIRTGAWHQVRDLLAAADIAGLPRTRCSGYPIKLLNYLGLGLPTVASQGSARQIAGVVAVPDHDPAAFAAALQALVDDPARREALGRAARQDIAARFTWDAMARRLEELYRTLLP